MHIDTHVAQLGNRRDPATGAISVPVYHSATFAHPGPGQSTGYDYTRTGNPTRQALEEETARLERGARGLAFASGMAAIDCLCRLFGPGDRLVVSDDLYGGTYRLFERILRPLGIDVAYVDTGDLEAVERAVNERTRALFLETPTNPLMKISDIRGCVRIARARGIITIVDNTFMTPYFQRPLELGADVVVHSATKYLGGHNDVLAGLLVAKDPALGERLQFYQNSAGAVLSPHDSWLLLRGMKTLALRMQRHEANAAAVARWLETHPLVTRVYYPGLDGHPRRSVHEQQATGFGGMVSFDVADARLVAPLLSNVRLITFAESLGGVESLITYPAVQTHSDIPPEVREAIGVTDRLVRLSIGIEHVDDLIADLEQALKAAEREVKRVGL
ncbi:MAG: PLP-dependent transferase [Alicyclobacillaceae bacterium]|nr:PLP-dependent transferase [Alicyclobacillaceae bacterium]